MLCVPIYNMKLAMMQKTTIFTTFSAHTKMTTEKLGQDEVFGRKYTIQYTWRIWVWNNSSKHLVKYVGITGNGLLPWLENAH